MEVSFHNIYPKCAMINNFFTLDFRKKQKEDYYNSIPKEIPNSLANTEFWLLRGSEESSFSTLATPLSSSWTLVQFPWLGCCQALKLTPWLLSAPGFRPLKLTQPITIELFAPSCVLNMEVYYLFCSWKVCYKSYKKSHLLVGVNTHSKFNEERFSVSCIS